MILFFPKQGTALRLKTTTNKQTGKYQLKKKAGSEFREISPRSRSARYSKNCDNFHWFLYSVTPLITVSPADPAKGSCLSISVQISAGQCNQAVPIPDTLLSLHLGHIQSIDMHDVKWVKHLFSKKSLTLWQSIKWLQCQSVRAHQNQGWENVLIIFRALNYKIWGSNNAHYIWCAYYMLGALYNLTHLNILITTMWSGTEWNTCSYFPSLTPLSCSLWVEILSYAIDAGVGQETCFDYLYVGRSVNVPLRN